MLEDTDSPRKIAQLKNDVFDIALFCTSRCGGILKACCCCTKANVVEKEAVFRDQEQSPYCQEPSCCEESSALPTFSKL